MNFSQKKSITDRNENKIDKSETQIEVLDSIKIANKKSHYDTVEDLGTIDNRTHEKHSMPEVKIEDQIDKKSKQQFNDSAQTLQQKIEIFNKMKSGPSTRMTSHNVNSELESPEFTCRPPSVPNQFSLLQNIFMDPEIRHNKRNSEIIIDDETPSILDLHKQPQTLYEQQRSSCE